MNAPPTVSNPPAAPGLTGAFRRSESRGDASAGAPIFSPAASAFRIPGMERIRDPWVCGIAVTIFVAIVLATATRVSPPTPLSSELPEKTAAMHAAARSAPTAAAYAWLTARQRKDYEPLLTRIPAPPRAARIEVATGGFAHWLRFLPVAPKDTPVTSGKRKVIRPAGDARIAAAIRLQPSNDRLLAGSNMLVRLRAEYLWTARRHDDLAFHFTSGHLATWPGWASGERPTVSGRNVTFSKSFDLDHGRENFCGYLETLFQYGSIHSALRDTQPVTDGSLAPGDLFLRPAKKGSLSLMVLDACTAEDGALMVLLGDAGIPAQTFHVLNNAEGNPWFRIARDRDITLPDGRVLRLADLRRWR